MAGQPGNAGNNANYALPPAHLEHPLYSAYSHPAYAQHALRQQQQQRRAQSASSQLVGGLSYEALFAQQGLEGGQSAVDAVQGASASVSVVSQGLPVVSASPAVPQLGLPQLADLQAVPPFFPPHTALEQSQAPVMVPVAVEAAVGQPHPAPLPPQPAVLPPPPPPAQPPAPSSSSLVPPSSVPPVARPLSGPGSRQRWTASEDAELIRLVKLLPPLTWAEIGEKMGRKGGGCGMRWYKVLRERLAKEVAAQQAAPTEENSRSATVEAVSNASAPVLAPPALPTPPISTPSAPSALLPSPNMTVGSSSSANAFAAPLAVMDGETATLAAAPRTRRVIANARTGIPVELPTVPAASVPFTSLNISFSSALDPTLASLGAPATSTSASPSLESPAPPAEKHINAGPHFLPPSALVPNPPIPFDPNTVLRGRRTRAINDLEKEQNEVREKREEEKRRRLEERAKGKERELDEEGTGGEGGEGGGEQPGEKKKKVKKRGTAVHACPAEGCTAAFKRSEHLRRHYKSVHRGEKPWPCTIEGCGKSFSRKDNLQQHQALVHFVRATYTYPSGKSTADPPSPSSAEGVITTFEKVEVTRSAASTTGEKKKTSRAKSKAIPPAVQPEQVEEQAESGEGQPDFDFQGALQMLAAATGGAEGGEGVPEQ